MEKKVEMGEKINLSQFNRKGHQMKIHIKISPALAGINRR